MLAVERQQKILALLEERGTVRTIDLAEEFAVTDETIRRDLQSMDESGQLTRTHGGATSLSGRPKLQSFTERRSLNVDKKKAIAQVLIDQIQPGRTYAFDSSTTAFALVSILPDLPYRIVTNAYAVIDHMVRLENVELVSTGGRYDQKTQTFIGGDSQQALRRYQIHTAFISCIGLDAQRGASEGFEQQALFKENLVQIAEQVVLLVDSTKLDKQSEYFFAEIKNLSMIVTDSGASPEFVKQLHDKGCTVRIAE
ncbi:DeoR/GlpR transcriptional regulator [Puniceicoccales bacterium CK1056]|uniref:DeoR/GlpR transcriptional regulator n=1 Tax=Oceanipulchritudo coccoides TaxID=2706888 RepID=A0A6B2M415_9BACT|nr:DeoR/GlpR family DNA-binding transcription regulator [Oceanipulchritudo coccoides]NDV62844.1 DeoR/GlpR transcriptional regulator [Oceanipulchritudo coccoides]